MILLGDIRFITPAAFRAAAAGIGRCYQSVLKNLMRPFRRINGRLTKTEASTAP
jgi:hypothetical protein